jgi:hypothetical protein
MKLHVNNKRPCATGSTQWREGGPEKRFGVRVRLAALVAAAVVTPLAVAGDAGDFYIAHEWGTFTSVQGPDGVLQEWKPLESSRLPGFVYDWTKPGLGRRPTGLLAYSKVELQTLQRMETPVIYFYAEKPQRVDVSVRFPKGLITEWYPQSAQIGPSMVPMPGLISSLDHYAHRAGARADFSFTSLLSAAATPASRARWEVEILSKDKTRTNPALLPTDSSGSHYFAARDTDANVLALKSPAVTNSTVEHEKFVFYRGVGNFQTPLRVFVEPNETITIENMEKEALSDVFLLEVHEGKGSYVHVLELAPGAHQAVRGRGPEAQSVDRICSDLGAEMERCLVRRGLYSREAAAMVHTWQDSWFVEDGVRVLYVLPRAWTDRTLPLRLDPQPQQLERVMVGRAEVLMPSVLARLNQELAKAGPPDARTTEETLAQLRKLGRFAEPALNLATAGFSSEFKERAWELLHLAATTGQVVARQ